MNNKLVTIHNQISHDSTCHDIIFLLTGLHIYTDEYKVQGPT